MSDTYRDRQRTKIIDVAERVLTDEGLSALQARRIAKDSGCAIGTLYNIFNDIDGLILAVNERTLNELGQTLQQSATQSNPGDLKGRLMALAFAYLAFAQANPRRWRAVFDHRLPDGSEVPAFYVENRQGLLALIAIEIETAILDATARSDAAQALFSAVHGIVLLSLDEKLGNFDPGMCKRQISFILGNVTLGLSKETAAREPVVSS
jgi:AcrR family transcriptional regulator